MNKRTIKTISIVSLLLLVPSIAIAYDHEWSNHFEGVAGGLQIQAATQELCVLASAVAVGNAAKDNCTYPYSNPVEHGVRIGAKEDCSCQCVDGVCICTDKLDIFCIIKEKK